MITNLMFNRYRAAVRCELDVSSLKNSNLGKILIVDKDPFSRENLADMLSLDGYEVVEADENVNLIEFVNQTNPDLILLELMLPKVKTLDICRQLKNSQQTGIIPLIFMTIGGDRRARMKCLEAGSDDLLLKPIERLELTARVKPLIQQKRLNEDLDQTEQVLFSLAEIVENPGSKNGKSSSQLANLVQAFGEYLQLNTRQIESLIYAAYLHDIGTVVVPEKILLKKGKLTPQEKEIIHQHVLIGEKICQPLKSRLDILPIIRHHHERWDGSGYPDGLAGSDIPWLAQVFQIIDIYDALTSERPYKKALNTKEALEIIAEETAKGWRNPKLVEEFTCFITKYKD